MRINQAGIREYNIMIFVLNTLMSLTAYINIEWSDMATDTLNLKYLGPCCRCVRECMSEGVYEYVCVRVCVSE